jgi:hypothetical protein
MAEEQSEETKQEAREFMAGLVGTGDTQAPVPMNGPAVDIDIAAWRCTFFSNNKDPDLMESFWSEYYNPTSSSLWRMVYDEPEYNENLEDTIQISIAFMKKTESLKDHCFGIMHTLESLETEGIWFFAGPDPEKLFATNEDTSWFSWNQIGPEANNYVKRVVADLMLPIDGKINGKVIKDTKIF